MLANSHRPKSPLAQQEKDVDDLTFDRYAANNHRDNSHNDDHSEVKDNYATSTRNNRSQSPQSPNTNGGATVTLEDLEFGSNKLHDSSNYNNKSVTGHKDNRANRTTLTTLNNRNTSSPSSSFENTIHFNTNNTNNDRFNNTSNHNNHTYRDNSTNQNNNRNNAHPFAQYFSSFFPVSSQQQRRHRNSFVESLNEHTQHNNNSNNNNNNNITNNTGNNSTNNATNNIMNSLSRNYYFRSPFAYDYHPGDSLIFSVDVDDENNNNSNNNSNNNANDAVYRGGLNIRTILSAFILFFGGLAMVITGATLYWQSGFKDGMSIFIVGMIMILPGSYGMTLVTGYCLRWPGYEADRLPLL